MADVSEISGPARDWLAAKRLELNARFRLLQRRFPRLTAEAVLSLCRELLPPLAGAGGPGTAELLTSIYDLVLLHAGRGTLAPGGGGSPGIAELLRVTFPRMRSHLLARPTDLPAALSNAVENLGSRGLEMARGLAELANVASADDAMLDAGAVLAWRLGEARLRTTALTKARQLSPAVVLSALGLTCPADSLPRILDGLTNDGWRRPEAFLSKPPAASGSWKVAALLGNFRGFDGHFDHPPLLLDSGIHGGHHRFWVRSGTAQYRLDADIFGWVCRPDGSVDYSIAKPAKHIGVGLNTSCVSAPNLLAYTIADSFRVRVLIRDRGPP